MPLSATFIGDYEQLQLTLGTEQQIEELKSRNLD